MRFHATVPGRASKEMAGVCMQWRLASGPPAQRTRSSCARLGWQAWRRDHSLLDGISTVLPPLCPPGSRASLAMCIAALAMQQQCRICAAEARVASGWGMQTQQDRLASRQLRRMSTDTQKRAARGAQSQHPAQPPAAPPARESRTGAAWWAHGARRRCLRRLLRSASPGCCPCGSRARCPGRWQWPGHCACAARCGAIPCGCWAMCGTRWPGRRASESRC